MGKMDASSLTIPVVLSEVVAPSGTWSQSDQAVLERALSAMATWLLPLGDEALFPPLNTIPSPGEEGGETTPRLGLRFYWINDAEMSVYNRHYRGKEGPTDVLSFAGLELPPEAMEEWSLNALSEPGAPQNAGKPVELDLGELMISRETALRQALRHGYTPVAEFWKLLTHGFLHLLGYDHERSTAEEALMERRERECRRFHMEITGDPFQKSGGALSSSSHERDS